MKAFIHKNSDLLIAKKTVTMLTYRQDRNTDL